MNIFKYRVLLNHMLSLPEMPFLSLKYEMNPYVGKAVRSLENRFNNVQAVRVFGKEINVLGYRSLEDSSSPLIFHDVIINMDGKILEEYEFVPAKDRIFTPFYKTKNIKDKLKKIEDYKNKITEIKEQNLVDIEKALLPMQLFKHSMEEVEKLLKKQLKLVRTRNPEAYLEANNKHELMIEAHIIGANYVVDWKPNLVEGTPVKYAD